MAAIDPTRGNQASLKWLLYDGHGNLVRTMAPDYTLSGFQWRGVWGEVQGSLGAGRGYCANLGHPEDETGLVYMRARYCEPATGRFISGDPARDGVNWYLYADGNPVVIVDSSGCSTLAEILIDIKNDVQNQLRQVQMGEVARQRALDQIERAIYKWAERMADALESDAWQIFGEGNVEMIGIHGRFRIMFHITKDKMFPHTVPHIQFAASGEKTVYFWLDANGVGHWASSG